MVGISRCCADVLGEIALGVFLRMKSSLRKWSEELRNAGKTAGQPRKTFVADGPLMGHWCATDGSGQSWRDSELAHRSAGVKPDNLAASKVEVLCLGCS